MWLDPNDILAQAAVGDGILKSTSASHSITSTPITIKHTPGTEFHVRPSLPCNNSAHRIAHVPQGTYHTAAPNGFDSSHLALRQNFQYFCQNIQT